MSMHKTIFLAGYSNRTLESIKRYLSQETKGAMSPIIW